MFFRTVLILLLLGGALVFTSYAQIEGQVENQLFFKETTFDLFAYPNGDLDEHFTEVLTQRAEEQFPKARLRLVQSYITLDKPRKVVAHYSNLCGKRFSKIGESFIYIFSEINNKPATRIEIYPVQIGRIYEEFWPTRIDLYLIRYPLSVKAALSADRSLETLQRRTGEFYYPGTLREDVALLDMEEYGSQAEVFVVETGDNFEDVYSFFRRRHGPFHVRPARDGDLLTRDFEIDVSSGLAPEEIERRVLYVYVEENPIVVDRTGNSQLYRNKVFVRYVFWPKPPER